MLWIIVFLEGDFLKTSCWDIVMNMSLSRSMWQMLCGCNHLSCHVMSCLVIYTSEVQSNVTHNCIILRFVNETTYEFVSLFWLMQLNLWYNAGDPITAYYHINAHIIVNGFDITWFFEIKGIVIIFLSGLVFDWWIISTFNFEIKQVFGIRVLVRLMVHLRYWNVFWWDQ